MYYKEVRWKENAIKTSVPFSDTFISSSPYSIFRIFFNTSSIANSELALSGTVFSLLVSTLCDFVVFPHISRGCPENAQYAKLPIQPYLWGISESNDEEKMRAGGTDRPAKYCPRSISSISGRFYISSHKRMILALLCMADPHLFV